MRASIRQVAERAGVSPMTVTNVLKNRANQVSEETRRRVLSAVEDLNYIPVRSAMQNRHVQTNAIGVLFLQDMEGAVGHPTFLGICNHAKQLDYDLTILLRSEPNWQKPGVQSHFLDHRSDGFIFIGEERPDISALLVRNKIPVVECYSVAPPEGVARVLGDNRQAMRLAVEKLVALGHRRIAHIGGPEMISEARERADGFCEAVSDLLGVDGADFVVQGDSWGDLWGFDYGNDPGLKSRPVVEAALNLNATAYVCANDLYALALWKMAEQRGLRVPEDLSITGMDNIVEAAHKGLTTISTPFNLIGRTAVDVLHQLLNGAEPKEVSRVLPVELVERKSIGPAAR